MRTGESEPGSINPSQSPESEYIFADSVLEEIVQIAEAPWDGTETCNAEEGIEDLGINFDPDTSGRVDIVTGRFAHCWGGVA